MNELETNSDSIDQPTSPDGDRNGDVNALGDQSKPSQSGSSQTESTLQTVDADSGSDSFVLLKNVSRIYKSKQSADDVTALENINLSMKPGERLALLGKSGSGKSTLLNLLGGLDRPSSGTITVDEQEITTLDSSQMANYRQRSVGMIFQAFNLISTKTAIQNVELPFVFAGASPPVRREKAKSALEAVGLGDRLRHRPTQLSGGEQQRVAIARAVANEPRLLLADEPTGNLDSATAAEIMAQITAFSEEKQAAVILVTHDEELAQDFAHRIIRLRDGRIVGSV